MKRNYLKILFLLLSILLLSSCTSEIPANQAVTKPASTKKVSAKVFAVGFAGADGITIDYSGNMYVGNRRSNVISRVSPKGKVENFVELACEELLCMTVDQKNNIYAAGKDKVFRISPAGEVEELAGDFTCADDLRLDEQGNLYITDSFENRVYKLTPQLEKSIFIDSDISQEELTTAWHITGITFDSNYQYLYIARMQKGEILRYPINSDGTAGKPEVVAKGLEEPDHLDMDADGRLYVTLFRTGSLIRIDQGGQLEQLSQGDMEYATGIVLGRSGFDANSAFIADYGKDVVYQIKIKEQ